MLVKAFLYTKRFSNLVLNQMALMSMENITLIENILQRGICQYDKILNAHMLILNTYNRALDLPKKNMLKPFYRLLTSIKCYP